MEFDIDTINLFARVVSVHNVVDVNVNVYIDECRHYEMDVDEDGDEGLCEDDVGVYNVCAANVDDKSSVDDLVAHMYCAARVPRRILMMMMMMMTTLIWLR